MAFFRKRRFTRDNLRAFTIPIAIGDPLASRQVAAVQGAAVREMQGHNGAFRGWASVYSGAMSTAYLPGSINMAVISAAGGSVAPVSYGQLGSFGSGQLPGTAGPVFPTISALQALRSVGSSIRGG